jgi:hypothetical protein
MWPTSHLMRKWRSPAQNRKRPVASKRIQYDAAVSLCHRLNYDCGFQIRWNVPTLELQPESIMPKRGEVSGPDSEEIETGHHYFLDIDMTSEASMAIFADPSTSECRWRCETEPRRSAFSLINLIRPVDFVLRDRQGIEIVRIRRSSVLPLRFEIVRSGQVVGRVCLRGLLLGNKYTIDLSEGTTWTIHLPLFSMQFHGESRGGFPLWIVVGPSKRQWSLLISRDSDDLRLLAGLAFIHRRWWCYA